MKTLTFILAFMVMAQANFAQATNEEVVADTTEIKVGNKVISIVKNEDDQRDVRISDANSQDWNMDDDTDGDDDEKKKKKNVEVDFLNLDLGMNFLTQDMSFNLPAELDVLDTKPLNSTHFGMHFLRTRVNLIAHHVNLVTAITLDNNRFAFRENFILQPNADTLTIIPDSIEYRKNKLISWYGQIPLLLNFQTNPGNINKNFHLSVGGFAGLLISAKTKRKSEIGGKVNKSDDYNLNRFRYGVTGRIGYRNLELYCNYNLSSMFVEGQGPEIMPVTFGISLTGMM